MKKQTFLSFFFLFLSFLTFFNCAAKQQTSNSSLRPQLYTVDVISFPTVDEDAYRVRLQPTTDAGGSISRGSGTNGEVIAPLAQGRPAPFAGVLFNGAAAARIEVEFRAQQAQCLIHNQATVDGLSARAIADIRNLQTSLNAQVSSYNLMLQSRDDELDRLYKLNETLQRQSNQTLQYTLIGIGAFILGAGIATGITVLARP